MGADARLAFGPRRLAVRPRPCRSPAGRRAMTRKAVEVAAGVLLREDSCYLLGQRAPDAVYAATGSFPAARSSWRESGAGSGPRLDEELGIPRHAAAALAVPRAPLRACPSPALPRVAAWEGELADQVPGALAWVRRGPRAPMLPANGPILKAPAPAAHDGHHQAAEIGVEVSSTRSSVRSRRPAPGAGARGDPAEDARGPSRARRLARVRAHGGLLVVNEDEALARPHRRRRRASAGAPADGVQERLDFPWVGTSCHDRAELERAAAHELDYALLGPVQPTLTHPARRDGLGRFASTAAGLPLPVFALGGLAADDMGVRAMPARTASPRSRAIWRPRD